MIVRDVEAHDAPQGQVEDSAKKQRLDQGPNEAQDSVLIPELEFPERKQKEEFPGPAQLSESDDPHLLPQSFRFPRLAGPPCKINVSRPKEAKANASSQFVTPQRLRA
jgi:hypothetical protein